METLRPDEQQLLESELSNGESLVWAGKPNTSVIFHPSDWSTIPFSLFWCGFTLFWEGSALGFPHSWQNVRISFFAIWGIPFILIGQYLLWARFIYTAWRKARTVYAVTTQRVFTLSSGKVVSAFIDSLPVVARRVRTDGIGTITFGEFSATRTGRSYGAGTNVDPLYLSAGIPVFADIDDANAVYDIVADIRSHTKRS